MPLLTKTEVSLSYQLVGPELKKDVPPAVLIHGLGANQAFWFLGALRHLGHDRAHLIYDLRGHGASSMPDGGYDLITMASDLLDLLDRLGIDKAHIVGHSYGARVALVFALRHPERVESLTIADTQIRALQGPMKLGEWPHWPEWKADLASRGVTSFPPEDSVIDFSLLAALGSRGSSGASDQPGMLSKINPAAQVGGGGGASRRIDLQSRQMGAKGAEKWQALMARESVTNELHDESCIKVDGINDLEMPVMLMYGAMSHCVPTADKMMELVPNGRRVLVPGGGHFFPIVKAQYFARVLNGFLARVEAGVVLPKGQTVSPAVAAMAQSNSAQTITLGSARYRGARRMTPAFAALTQRRRGA
jgi:pimeloyl-ACP methyl ester carboxylesterase